MSTSPHREDAGQSRTPTGRRSDKHEATAPRPRDAPTATASLMRRAAAATVLVLLLAGCSDNGDPGPAGPAETADAPKTAPTPTSAASSSTITAVRAITGGEAVELTKADLPDSPPDGFNRAEVEALADRALDLARRGVSPALEGLSPADAFAYVFAGQYPRTTEAARDDSRAATGGYDWEWAWASLFDKQPRTPARVLSARWTVESEPAKLGDGTSAPLLRVVLSVIFEHDVPVETTEDAAGSPGPVEPVLVKRSIVVQGYRPLGGPAWWPAVGVQTEPLLGGKCAPVNGSLLTPTRNQKIIREDLQKLRTALNDPADIDASSESTAGSIKAYVEKFCDQ
jgi:hypothetical protein